MWGDTENDSKVKQFSCDTHVCYVKNACIMWKC